MKRLGVSALLALALLGSALPNANAAVTPGSKCPKAGVKQTYKGKVYTCIKLGKKLYWNNGVRIVTSKPTPTQTASPTPKSSSSETKIGGSINNLSADWREAPLGPELVFSFDLDLNLPENSTLSNFEYVLTSRSASTPRLYSSKLNKNSSQQEIVFTFAQNTMYNGIFEVAFTEFIANAVFKEGRIGSTASLTSIPTYISDLCTPVISVASVLLGFRVTLSQGCLKQYEFISVEESISDSNAAPSTGYRQIYLGNVIPANILTATTESRWVKVRYTNKAGLYGPYSNTVKVKPSNP
jgi:hypothetical protein